MILIQFILIPLLLLLLVMYFVRLRSRFFMRAIALLVGILGIVLVARPEWSTVVSQALGVGRGADLITYLGLGRTFLRISPALLQTAVPGNAFDQPNPRRGYRRSTLAAAPPGGDTETTPDATSKS